MPSLAMGFRALTVEGSAFPVSVSHIVLMRAEEEMLWSDTPAVVAVMTHVQTIENRTIVQYPSESMDEDTFIINSHLPMTVRHPASHPLPTSKQIICPLDFGPKAFFWRESFRVASRHRLNLQRSDMS